MHARCLNYGDRHAHLNATEQDSFISQAVMLASASPGPAALIPLGASRQPGKARRAGKPFHDYSIVNYEKINASNFLVALTFVELRA